MIGLMMKKQKTAEELHGLILELVRRNPDFNGVEPHKPYWHEPDANNCNWDLSSWSGSELLVSEAADSIRDEVRALRNKYDIAEPT